MNNFILKMLLSIVPPDMIAEKLLNHINKTIFKKNGPALLKAQLSAFILKYPKIGEYAEPTELENAFKETDKLFNSEQGSVTADAWLALLKKN